MNLYMLLLGCRPAGRNTEQHDVYFGIAETLDDLGEDIVSSWPEAKGKIHVDAVRVVRKVDEYAITIIPRDGESGDSQLYFINMGGYIGGSFNEYHHKLLTVQHCMAEAVARAKQSTFYKEYNSGKAVAHVDDKYGVDVDEAAAVKDILPARYRKRYSIYCEKNEDGRLREDEIITGYFNLKKLPKV